MITTDPSFDISSSCALISDNPFFVCGCLLSNIEYYGAAAFVGLNWWTSL